MSHQRDTEYLFGGGRNRQVIRTCRVVTRDVPGMMQFPARHAVYFGRSRSDEVRANWPLRPLGLRPQALLLLLELRRHRRAEVLHLEDLADFDFGPAVEGSALDPVDRLLE